MRWIVGLLLLVALLGWIAAEVPLDTPVETPGAARWRRTVDGWEHPVWLGGGKSARQPALHPVVVGLLQVMLASAALIAFSPQGQPRPTHQPSSHRRVDAS